MKMLTGSFVVTQLEMVERTNPGKRANKMYLAFRHSFNRGHVTTSCFPLIGKFAAIKSVGTITLRGKTILPGKFQIRRNVITMIKSTIFMKSTVVRAAIGTQIGSADAVQVMLRSQIEKSSATKRTVRTTFGMNAGYIAVFRSRNDVDGSVEGL